MNKRKAQANVISVVIIASISIGLIVVLLNYAVYSLESVAQQAEFENAKTSMKILAEETINTILSGVGAEVKFPSRTVRLNFITLNKDLKLVLSSNSFGPYEITLDSNILIVKCYGGEYASYENQVIYGVYYNPAFVEDIYSTPLVQTKWDINVGRVSAELNFTRLLLMEYRVSGSSNNEIIIEVAYVDAYWESGTTTSSGTVEVFYQDSLEEQIYDNAVSGTTTITFELYLDSTLLGSKTITIEGSHQLKIKIVKHQILYKLR
ncbi:MAG: hypothetical protein DRJ26_04235 [Candidatus Methanomethylicota archaeon]|uniref:Uncharacterized protein n=1 Tax=Thermoproteota archaeon TaxID=2056631 RepID=A0A497F0H1_9CREN|nr:MAG: hypothetical protein DRJ26_04235 [Candidatus Verstraetearchaeota archaeon]